MRSTIQKLLSQALTAVAADMQTATLAEMDPQIERTRDPRHGDFTSNVAMRAAKPLGIAPRQIAEKIIAHIPASPAVERVELAGPGFINLTLTTPEWHQETAKVLAAGASYGHSDSGAGKRVLVEFVSANPTGPLHVGHGRLAAFGACVANLLKATGYTVDTEYYVNDAGRQMEILALSVWLRFLEASGIALSFPENCYQGEYCRAIAEEIASKHGSEMTGDIVALSALINDAQLQPEARLDALIEFAKQQLGPDGFEVFLAAALNNILSDIRDDLAEFGVTYDRWYSEKSLSDNNAISAAIDDLKRKGLLYEKDGALWFRTSDYGDDKDRVVVRENGITTYFASDIAYHREKIERGYDQLVDCLGSDHHGYIARLQAALKGFGKSADALDVCLVQFVILFRGKEKVQMTTRGGTYVTLRDLRTEVGNDAARFFYVSRSNDQHLEFDLELAKSQSTDNPVYYVQYAHARIVSTLRKLIDSGFTLPKNSAEKLAPLTTTEEVALMRELSRFGEVVATAAQSRGPQMIVQYLRTLASEFHSYYNTQRVLVDEEPLRNARVLLISAVQQVLANGLGLLGVSAPESM